MSQVKRRDLEPIISQNKTVWENLSIQEMNIDYNLVICHKRLFPESLGRKLLCIGFGEGQNLAYLAAQGFNCYGTEIAGSRLLFTKKMLKQKRLKADLRLVKSNILPFSDNFFDIVVAWQSLYYNVRTTLQKSLSEIKRVLKPKGQFLSSMVSPRQKLLCYKKIAALTYHPSPRTGQENCTLVCLKNKKQIHSFYKAFKNIKIGYYSSELFRGPNFHWVIYCRKKE